MIERMTKFAVIAALCSSTVAVARLTTQTCETLLLGKVPAVQSREFHQALSAWSERDDLTADEMIHADFITGVGIHRHPVLLVQTPLRLFILTLSGHQIQVYPKVKETVENSYTLVGESALSTRPSGQRYEFEVNGSLLILVFQKERSRHLNVQILKNVRVAY